MIPSVLAFALSGVYTIVDGLFIGRSLGDIGLAAIALGFPIAAFIQAVGTGIGLAGGIHFTIFGAQNDERKQQNCFSGTAWLLLMNRFLLIYGSEQSVAIYSCISYITAIIYLLLQGVGDGCQPLISLYYGENKNADVRQTRRIAYFTAFVISAVCAAAVFLTRTKIGLLFGASASANAGVGRYLPFFLATVLLLSFVRITTSYFYATEKAALSYLLVYAEPVCTLVFLLTLPLALKLNGVWMAIPAAQVCAFVIALVAKCRVDRLTRL